MARLERLRLRAFVLGGVLLISGVVVHFMPTVAASGDKTEAWMENNLPTSVGNYRMLSSTLNPKQSYRMDDSTYEVLKPYGIVSRIFSSLGRRYDAVVIASRSKESFHDPRVCFTAQGFAIESEQVESVQTKTKGRIPVTVANLNNQRSGKRLAIFFYKGPDGYHASTLGFKFGLFKAQMLGGSNLDGVFYRFIALSDNISREQLFEFVANFMDEAGKVSKGYF